MKQLKVCILLSILFVSLSSIINLPKADALTSPSRTYIICLSGVGGWDFVGGFDPSRTKDGAISALSFHDAKKMPRVHPMIDKAPPYYSAPYQVVSDWTFYRSIVETGKDVIIVNTHGEIIPVPSGYSREGWTDKIAEAMLERKVTWVHTAGYPFYYSWQQGDVGGNFWGGAGFQRLMSHINKGSVTLSSDRETDLVDLSTFAMEDALKHFDYAYYVQVQRGRPLKSTDFKDYTTMPIWGTLDEEMTGAVLAFVKPN